MATTTKRTATLTPTGPDEWRLVLTVRGKTRAYALARLGPTLYRLDGGEGPRPYVVDTARGTCDCAAGGWGKACKHRDVCLMLERTGALDGEGEVTLDDERHAAECGC